MIILSGSSSSIAKHLLPMMRDKFQVCAFDDENGNIRDKDFLNRLIAEVKPSVFINCKDFRDIEEAEYKREEAYLLNGFIPGELAELCKEWHILLFQLSTTFVYESNENRYYTENDREVPTNVFGDSKLLGERKIKESGCKHCILRVPPYFGKGGNFFADLIQKMKDETEIDTIRKQVLMPTYAKDIGNAILTLISKKLEGIYNYANTSELSLKEFLTKLTEIYNKQGKKYFLPKIKEFDYEDFLSPVEWPFYNKISLEKIKSVEDINIRSVDESLREFIIENYQYI